MKEYSISDVRVINSSRVWETKSKAQLRVLVREQIGWVSQVFLRIRAESWEISGQDLRGLRLYTVRRIPKDSVGGKEFHRLRWEFILALEGKIHFILEDLRKNKKEIIVTAENGVLLPPYVLHTYTALEENSGLLVLCNTDFEPENPKTHDTFSEEEFQKLQAQTANE